MLLQHTHRPTMAIPGSQQPCLWNCVLVLLLLHTALTTGLPCRHLWTVDNTLPRDGLQLLQDMAPSPLQPCHLQHQPFFPDTLRNTHLNPQQAAATALRILQHLFHTLSTNAISHRWHTHPRHALLNKLHHYIHHLKECIPADAVLFKGPRNPLLAVNKYFRDLHLFLRTHNHSACAWDHIHLEARDAFQHVDRLIWQMKHQAPLDPTKPMDSKHSSPVSTSGYTLSDGSSSPDSDDSVLLTPLPDGMSR